jgi:hypothetical protein
MNIRFQNFFLFLVIGKEILEKTKNFNNFDEFAEFADEIFNQHFSSTKFHLECSSFDYFTFQSSNLDENINNLINEIYQLTSKKMIL